MSRDWVVKMVMASMNMNEKRERLRIGILGAARIAPTALVAPAHVLGHRLVGVASRDRSRAEQFAIVNRIERAVDSYEELIADPEINVIYNPLHNGAHSSWNLRALAAGKHVLTEKPSASNATRAIEVRDFAKSTDLVFMEAFHYAYHPVITRTLEIIESGEIGDISRVESVFNVSAPEASDPRWQLELAGGALMDIGCYSLHVQRMLAQTIAGTEPTVVSAKAKLWAPEIDSSFDIELKYGSGLKAIARCDMDAEWLNVVTIEGSLGRITVPGFVQPGMDDRVIVEVGGSSRTEHLGQLSSYTHQLTAFSNAVDFDAPILTGPDDAVATMELIDAVYLAAGLHPRP
jgi:predicted dehydrogenase